MSKSIFKLHNVDDGTEVDTSKIADNDFIVARIEKSDFNKLNDMLQENEKLKAELDMLRQEIAMERQSAIVNGEEFIIGKKLKELKK